MPESAIVPPALLMLRLPLAREMLGVMLTPPPWVVIFRAPRQLPMLKDALVMFTVAPAPCAASVRLLVFSPVIVPVAVHWMPSGCVPLLFWTVTLPEASCVFSVESSSTFAPLPVSCTVR